MLKAVGTLGVKGLFNDYLIPPYIVLRLQRVLPRAYKEKRACNYNLSYYK